jgi:hypothetical protein
MDKQKIIDSHPSLCYNCKWARRPASDENTEKGYVGCAYFAHCENYYEDFVMCIIADASEVGKGWVDLKSPIFGEKSGITTNLQILAKEVKRCNKYEFKEI